MQLLDELRNFQIKRLRFQKRTTQHGETMTKLKSN